MPRTTTTTLTNTIKTFYDRIMLDVLDPTLKFYQFGIKKPLPTGEGTSVVWNLPRRLALGSNITESVVKASNGNALSTYKLSAVIQSYGGVTEVTDLVDMTSITDVMKMAAERLGAQAGETIERVIVGELFTQHVIGGPGTSSHNFIKTSTTLYDFWGTTSANIAAATPSTYVAEVSSTAVIAVSDVRKCIYSLKTLNVAPYEGNDYVAIVNTEVAEDIVGDSTWINFHQYATPGQNSLYTGEIGKIYGCRFVETNLGPVMRGSNYGSTASSLAYGTIIMGKGFYGVTELDGGVKTYMSQGAQKADPLNQVTTYGWKAHFATSLLNTSAGLVLWTGSGDTTSNLFAESAGSGFRQELPAAY